MQALSQEAQTLLQEIESKYVETEKLAKQFQLVAKNASAEASETVFGREQQSVRVNELKSKLNTLIKQYDDMSQVAQLYEDESQSILDLSALTLGKADRDELSALKYIKVSFPYFITCKLIKNHGMFRTRM